MDNIVTIKPDFSEEKTTQAAAILLRLNGGHVFEDGIHPQDVEVDSPIIIVRGNLNQDDIYKELIVAY